MGRARGRKRQGLDNRGPLQRIYDRDHANDDAPIDATPERLAKDEGSTLKGEKGEGHGQRVHQTRRFTSSVLTRISPLLTQRQVEAGEWYQDQHTRSRFALSVVAGYGERIGGGDPTNGLPRTEAQVIARRALFHAKQIWPLPVRRIMDRLLIEDDFPTIRGGARKRFIVAVGKHLDELAEHRGQPRTKPDQTVHISLARYGTFE